VVLEEEHVAPRVPAIAERVGVEVSDLGLGQPLDPGFVVQAVDALTGDQGERSWEGQSKSKAGVTSSITYLEADEVDDVDGAAPHAAGVEGVDELHDVEQREAVEHHLRNACGRAV
jgi:hypothetical protein